MGYSYVEHSSFYSYHFKPTTCCIRFHSQTSGMVALKSNRSLKVRLDYNSLFLLDGIFLSSKMEKVLQFCGRAQPHRPLLWNCAPPHDPY